LQTQFWQDQARSQILRLGRKNTLIWDKDFCFYQKTFGGKWLLKMYSVCGPRQNCLQKVFHWGASCWCRRVRHSENLYL